MCGECSGTFQLLFEDNGSSPRVRGMPLGTYELIGPMINGNPERATAHRLERHAVAETIGVLDEGGASVANPDPADVIALCREWGWEGTVWHHPDGRMAKLKVRDYPPRDGAA